MRIVSLLILSLLWPLTLQANCQRQFRVPVETLHEDEQPGNRLLFAVLNEMGCSYQKVYLGATVARHHRALANGDLDVLAEGSFLPERSKYAWFSEPYRVETIVLIGRDNNPKTTDVTSLQHISEKQLKVVMDETSWWGPEVFRLLPKWKAQHLYIPATQSGGDYKDLSINRADVLLTSEASFASAKLKYPQLRILLPNVHAENVGFMFSKRTVSNKEVNEFNEALRRTLSNKTDSEPEQTKQ